MIAPALAVVVPARNASATLDRCLAAVHRAAGGDVELIVVDDSSDDDTVAVAERLGAMVVRLGTSGGPARARNHGVASASAPLILFVDADVAIATDAIVRVRAAFGRDPGLAALFGSYDDQPAAGTLVSDYRNLLHHYVHQHANVDSATFWAGLGAVRRTAFVASGGFDEHFVRPSIEDIELGARLAAAGHRLQLDRDLRGTHLKRWTLASMVRTDVVCRALPWARLLLRGGRVPRDLNLRWRHRASGVLVWLVFVMLAASAVVPAARLPLWAAGLGAAALLAGLNGGFYRFLARRRGWRFAAAAFPLHALYYAYASGAFAWCCLEYAVSRMAAGITMGAAPDRR